MPAVVIPSPGTVPADNNNSAGVPLRAPSTAPFAWAGVTSVLALALAVAGIVLALVAVANAPPNTTSPWPAVDKNTALLCLVSLGFASWRLASVFGQWLAPVQHAASPSRIISNVGLVVALAVCLIVIGFSVSAVRTTLKYPPDPTFANARSPLSSFAFACGLISNALSMMSMFLFHYWQARRVTAH